MSPVYVAIGTVHFLKVVDLTFFRFSCMGLHVYI